MTIDGWGSDEFNPAEQFESQYTDAMLTLGRFNLAAFGKTGAGKSTLVNAVFGSKVAATGIGKPVTRATTYYEHPSGLFGMFDCVGFEMGDSGEALIAGLAEEVNRRRSMPLAEQMHVAWYVLRWSDRRFDDGQAAFVRALRELGLPVVFVISQVPMLPDETLHPDAVALAQAVRKEVGDLIVGGGPVHTNALSDPYFRSDVHGLDDLLRATFQAAPLGVHKALAAAQRIDLGRKRDDCPLIIGAAATVAAGIGATPIPFSDVALLVPAQVSMMAGIAAQYGLPITPVTAARLAGAAALAAGGLSVVGRGLANLAKLIPGLGTVAGGAINAGIASTLTIGVGRAWMAVCEHLNDKSPEEIETILAAGDDLQHIFLAAFTARAKPGWDQGVGSAA